MDDGKLTDAQRERFGKWIAEKAPLIGKCSVCGSRQYTLSDHFHDLPIYRGGNIIIGGGMAYPQVGLICTNCGNTQLINAVISGILENDTPEKKSEEGNSDD